MDGQRINKVPAVTYNRMVYPLLPMPIKGVIWYQGESNANNAAEARAYRTQFATLIRSWRRELNGGKGARLPLPLGAVAELRSGGGRAAGGVAVGAAARVDAGGARRFRTPARRSRSTSARRATSIRKNKQDVGRRLGLVGRRVAYREPVVSSGPTYRSHRFDGEPRDAHLRSRQWRARDERAETARSAASPSRARIRSSSGHARGSRAITCSCRASACASRSRCATRGRTIRPTRTSTARRAAGGSVPHRHVVSRAQLQIPRLAGIELGMTAGHPERASSSPRRAARAVMPRSLAACARARACPRWCRRRWAASCSSRRRLIAARSLVHELDLEPADRDRVAVLVVRVHRAESTHDIARRSGAAS